MDDIGKLVRYGGQGIRALCVITWNEDGIRPWMSAVRPTVRRVFFAMNRDRLLPAIFSKVNERTGTPIRTTVTTGVGIAVISTFVPLSELAELVNIGTLFTLILVAIGVLVLRRKRPDLERPFSCPGVPLVPILAVLTSFYLMLNLPTATWIRFAVWMVIGLAIYFLYGARHSRLTTDPSYSREADAAASDALVGH
jgi:APA family basic amino acid/polyamine antiporter